MSVWVSHPTGNTFVRALLAELAERDRPFHFFTTIGLPGFRNSNSRRSYPMAEGCMSTRPLLELLRLASERMVGGVCRPALNRFTDCVFQDLDRSVAREIARVNAPPRAVHAYEDCALETFSSARDRGSECIYELPIAYWETSRRILSEEAERLPEWEPTLGATRDSEEKLNRKTREIEGADVIVCPSQFVLNSIPESIRARRQCILAPFGSPVVPESRSQSGAKLRVLFAGLMSQRKGLADLLAAMRLLRRSDVELVILGAPAAPLSFYRQHGVEFIYERPRAHAGVLEIMRSCDVLVLPSLVEGRALVQQEALACGLPLIVTPNAGGEDLVVEGETGFLVPIRSPAAIAEKIDWFADHRTEMGEIRSACRAKAAEYTWSGYARRILDAVDAEVCPPATALISR